MESFFRLFIPVVVVVFVSACNAGSVGQGLQQTSVSSNPVPASGVGNGNVDASTAQTNQTALAASPERTPSQTAADNQSFNQKQLAALDNSSSLTSAQNAPTTSQRKMSFLPVEGAPQSAVSLLSKRLNSAGKSRGLAMLPSSANDADYKVKGFFSALDDGSGTLLVYIWDVYDNGGKRLYRFNGQERGSSSKSDPWQAIGDEELTRVADSTAANLRSWLDKQ